MKNTSLLYESSAFTLKNIWKKWKILASTCRNKVAFLKFDFSQISAIFSISRKKIGMKKYCLQQTKISCSIALIKDWLKNMFHLKKNCFHWQQLTAVWENRRTWFPQARKSVFISENVLFLLKLAFTSFIDGFH